MFLEFYMLQMSLLGEKEDEEKKKKNTVRLGGPMPRVGVVGVKVRWIRVVLEMAPGD